MSETQSSWPEYKNPDKRGGGAAEAIPVIDLGLERPRDPVTRAATARAVGQACAAHGFFVATGHGVPPETIAAAYAASARLFHISEEAKAALAAHEFDPIQRGFIRGDLETFSISRLGEPPVDGREPTDNPILALPNRWPSGVPGLREACLAYYGAAERVAFEIMRLFAIALGLAEDWFDDKFDDHMTQLAINHYTPGDNVFADREFRNAPHRDWGALTVLHQGDSPEGLQVRSGSGVWVDIPARTDAFVVNCGDLLSRWTNDRWMSALHRVVKAEPGQAQHERTSLAFFFEPSPDALIECITGRPGEAEAARYPPVTTYDFAAGKMRRAYVLNRVAEAVSVQRVAQELGGGGSRRPAES